LALLALIYMVGWAVVFMPAMRVLALVGGGLGAVLWLLYPEVSVYLLVLLFPFTFLFAVGPLNDIRPQDALLAVMMVTAGATALSGRRETDFLRGAAPKALFGLWLFVIVWDSIAFLHGPANQWLLRDPIRNTWYLYKDIWRDLFTFVVVACFLRERHPTRHLLTALQVAATVIAVWGIWQTVTTGERAIGPFKHQPNQLAAVLILIIPYMMSRLLLESGWRQRLLIGLSLLVMLRALWFTGSRGGFVACVVSFWPLAVMLPRKRLMAGALAGIIGLAVVLATKPDIMNRPVVQRYLTLTRPDELHTLEWRKEQWRHFMRRIGERPLLGTGSPVDHSIDTGDQLQTAHNAYLGFALRSGVPIAIAWVCILALAAAIAIRRGLTSARGEERVFWIGTMGFVTALAVHAMNETALLTSQVQQLFWIIMAFVVVHILPRRPHASRGDAMTPEPACR
ncbi:MAG TPA: O-antigen ligase family protein, partial [Candidatus Polarisedimenticolia bacterium]|nr:O-antigen ligase family protein [Candidatus Polarisedimenticolia bacterium]